MEKKIQSPNCSESRPSNFNNCSSAIATMQELQSRILSIFSVSGPWEEDTRNGEEGEERLLAMEEKIRDLLRLLNERLEKVHVAQCRMKEKERLMADQFRDFLAKEANFEKKLVLAAEEKRIWIESVEKSRQELDSVRDSTEKQLLELSVRKGVFEKLKEKRFEEWRKEQMQLTQEREKKYEERCRRIELKEVEIESKSEEVRLKLEDLDKRLREVDLIINSNDVSSKQIDSEYQKLGKKSEELKVWEKELNAKHEELELQQMKFDYSNRKLFSDTKLVEERLQKLEHREKYVRGQFNVLGLKEKQINERSNATALNQKQLEDQNRNLASKRMQLEDQRRELASKDKELALNQKQLEDQRRELASKDKEIEELSKALTSKQKKFEEQFKDVDQKEKQLEERLTEIASREKKIEDQHKELELQQMKFEYSNRKLFSDTKLVEERLQKLEHREKYVRGQFNELELKEKQINERSNAAALNQKQLEDQNRNLASKRMQLEDQRRELASKDKELALNQKQLEDQRRELASKDKEIEELSKALTSKQKKFEEQFKDVDQKEKQLEERLTEIASREKKIEDQHKELVLKHTHIKELSKDLESKAEKLEGQLRELALKEKQFEDKICSKEKTEPAKDRLPLNNTPCLSNINIQCCFTMDGPELQIFLNKKLNEHDSMQNEVFMALQFSPNPAKLVLNAMEGFYPPHLKNGDMEFDESVVRSTCSLLLEQLMRLSPEINPDVKTEAIKVASDWITKMKADVEVLGFLQLVAAYGLADSFDATNLLHDLEVVAQYCQTPKLLGVLGFGNEIKGFVKKLVEKNRQVAAIKFVKAFELIDQYPPVSLLKDYLKYSENNANKTVIDGYGSPAAKNEAINRRITDLQAVLNCIKDCKLESEYPPEDLRKQILTLKNEYANSQEIQKSLDEIQVLIKSHKYMDAIKHIYERKVVDKFPPVPLLKDYLLHTKKNAEDHCKTMNNSISSQIAGIVKEIQALQFLIGCIKEHKLEHEYSPTVLEGRMNDLKQMQREKQMVPRKRIRASHKQNTGGGLLERERCRSPGVACKTPSRIISTTTHNPTPESLQSKKKNHSSPWKFSAQGPTIVSNIKPENKSGGSKRSFSSSTLPEQKKARKESGNYKQQPHHTGASSANWCRYEQQPAGSSRIYYNNEYMDAGPRHYSLAGTEPYYDDSHAAGVFHL